VGDDRSVGAVDHTDFEEIAGGVGADEHHEAVVEIVDEHRMVERVNHVVVVDAVLASAGGDQRRIRANKLACRSTYRKLPCARTRVVSPRQRTQPAMCAEGRGAVGRRGGSEW